MRKIIIFIVLLSLPAFSFADTCPSVVDIKQNHLRGWKAYDIEENTPISANRYTYFKTDANNFALAEWTNTANKIGQIHCYYKDKDGSVLGAYLAKTNFSPSAAKNYWYTVTGALNCAVSLDKCEFHQKLAQNTRFARK